MRGSHSPNPSESHLSQKWPKEPLLIGEKEAARILGFSPRTLQKWRSRGDGPPFLKISSRGAVRYRRSDLEAWVTQCLRRSTSDDGSAPATERNGLTSARWNL